MPAAVFSMASKSRSGRKRPELTMISTTYTVTERNGCRLISGSPPIQAISMLAKGMPRTAVMDPHAARILDVSFAMGQPSALAALIADPEVLLQARLRVAEESDRLGLSSAAREWLATGRQGTSSLTIFSRMTGKEIEREDHPHDPDDLCRCRRLLDEVPEFQPRLPEMAAVSPVWAGLVSAWDELCVLMDEEAPDWRVGKGRTPKTNTRMKAIIEGGLDRT